MFYSILQGPPFDIDVVDGEDGDKVVAVSIATDDERIVSVVSTLEPFVLDDLETHQFMFEIVVFSEVDEGEPFRTMDRHIAANYIPPEIRESVMQIVVTSLNALIERAKPDRVYMVTKDRDLPEKAMTKYNMLLGALYDLGFMPENEGTDLPGRRFWTVQVA